MWLIQTSNSSGHRTVAPSRAQSSCASGTCCSSACLRQSRAHSKPPIMASTRWCRRTRPGTRRSPDAARTSRRPAAPHRGAGARRCGELDPSEIGGSGGQSPHGVADRWRTVAPPNQGRTGFAVRWCRAAPARPSTPCDTCEMPGRRRGGRCQDRCTCRIAGTASSSWSPASRPQGPSPSIEMSASR